MVSPLIRVASAFCCCLILGAQASRPAPPSGAIAGVVIDAATRQPIRRAIVTLSTVELEPQDAIAWTDANGRFAFGYLPAGGYELRVTKTGYEALAYGAATTRRPPGVLRLAPGEVRNDLLFPLHLVSSISGLVTDEDGDPISNAQVNVLRLGWRRGKRQFIPVTGANSDRTGLYRVSGLAPGDYVLEALRPGVAVLQIRPEVAAGDQPAQYSYTAQFYPGAERADEATPFAVQAGQEYTQIDFHLRGQPAVAVEGRMVPPAGIETPGPITVTATRMEFGDVRDTRGAVVGPDLTFQFGALPAGSYTVMAQATIDGRRYRGVQQIETGSDGARGLTIALEPGIDLSGTVSVEGPNVAKFLPASISLSPADDVPLSGPPPRGIVAKDGSFTIMGVPPGVWSIDTSRLPSGAYIKSMNLGDQDVLTEPMTIQSSTKAPLRIVIGTQAATIRGEVTKDGQPVRTTVLAAPEARFRHVMDFYRYDATDANGHFEIRGIRPGTYQLFAFEEFDWESIQDPEFLKPFESEGVTVRLREGENPPQKLSLIIPAPGAAQ